MLNLDLTQSFEDLVLCFFGAPYDSKSHWLDVVVFEVTGFVTIYGIFHIVFRRFRS